MNSALCVTRLPTRSSIDFLVSSLLVLVGLLQIGEASYYAKLANIQSTVGVWNQPFDPEVTNYDIQISPGTASIRFEFDVDFSQYSDATQWPAIAANGTELTYTDSQPATKTVVLPKSPNGSQVNLSVAIAGPPSALLPVHASASDQVEPLSQTIYTLQLSQVPDLDTLLGLTSLLIEDDHQRKVNLQPPFSPNPKVRSYDGFVLPDALRVRITPACASSAVAEVGGSTVVQGSFTWATIEHHTHTAIKVACKYGNEKREVVIELHEQLNLDDILQDLQIRIIGDESVGVVQHTSNGTFVIQALSPVVQFVPVFFERHVTMELERPGKAPQHMGMGIESPQLEVPAHGRAVVYLVVRNGAESRRVTIFIERSVVTTVAPQELHDSWAKSIGCAVAILTASSLGISACISGAVAVFYSGATISRALVVRFRSLTLLLQFIALSNVVRNPCQLTDFCVPLLWISLFPQEHANMESGALFRINSLQACRCILSVAMVLCTVALLHILLLAIHFGIGCCYYTVPHRVRSVGWEVQIILHVIYPTSCAATLCLLSNQSTFADLDMQQLSRFVILKHWWRFIAILWLVVPVVVALISALCVRNALRSGWIGWISHKAIAPERFMTSPDEGYFCDIMCDQLSTRRVERRAFTFVLPVLRWSTTVADIRPVQLNVPEKWEDASTGEDAYVLVGKRDDDDDGGSSDEDAKPFTTLIWLSNPGRLVELEVVSTVKLSFAHRDICCAEVGRFANVHWLEAFLSVESLLRLHQDIDPLLHDGATPIRARADQLQGRLTSGYLSFCFDGLRWPYLSPLELILRLSLGVLTGIGAIDFSNHPMVLVTVGVLTASFIFLLMREPPCTDVVENASILLGYFGILLVALSYLAHTAQIFTSEICSGVVLCIAACTVSPLLLQVLLATIALGSNAICTAGNAEEFDRIECCNVDLALRGPNRKWLLIVPAECTATVTDAFVHALPIGKGDARVYSHLGNLVKGTRPRLEFPVLDYLNTIDKLEPPLVQLFGHPRDSELGSAEYRSECIYADEDPWAMALEFAKRGPAASVEYAADIAAEILEIVRRKARSDQILVISIVPVPRLEALRREEFSDDETEALLSTAQSLE